MPPQPAISPSVRAQPVQSPLRPSTAQIEMQGVLIGAEKLIPGRLFAEYLFCVVARGGV
jgi:hypothetical protein